LGARPPGIRRPPSGRCWERPTIDLGKAPPTLAALQRQIAHRDCAWRSPTQPSTSACVTAQEPVLHQGHDPGTRYGPRRIHVLTVPGGRSSVWSQRSRAPGRLNRTGPEAQWSALGPQYTGSPGYSAGTNGHDRSAKPTARRTPHVDDLGRCRNPTAGSNPTAGCRGAGRPLANEAGVAGRAHPAVKLVPTPPGPTNVVLVRRATTVPFIRAPTGLKRTPTDNTTAALTGVVSYLRR
jgi:hypothetical protein